MTCIVTDATGMHSTIIHDMYCYRCDGHAFDKQNMTCIVTDATDRHGPSCGMSMHALCMRREEQEMPRVEMRVTAENLRAVNIE
jgi:hypothetical protein